MDSLDAVKLELEEAMERAANAYNALAYEIERAVERLKQANDQPLLSQN